MYAETKRKRPHEWLEGVSGVLGLAPPTYIFQIIQKVLKGYGTSLNTGREPISPKVFCQKISAILPNLAVSGRPYIGPPVYYFSNSSQLSCLLISTPPTFWVYWRVEPVATQPIMFLDIVRGGNSFKSVYFLNYGPVFSWLPIFRKIL
jgi:hypothetical protein